MVGGVQERDTLGAGGAVLGPPVATVVHILHHVLHKLGSGTGAVDPLLQLFEAIQQIIQHLVRVLLHVVTHAVGVVRLGQIVDGEEVGDKVVAAARLQVAVLGERGQQVRVVAAGNSGLHNILQSVRRGKVVVHVVARVQLILGRVVGALLPALRGGLVAHVPLVYHVGAVPVTRDHAEEIQGVQQLVRSTRKGRYVVQGSLGQRSLQRQHCVNAQLREAEHIAHIVGHLVARVEPSGILGRQLGHHLRNARTGSA